MIQNLIILTMNEKSIVQKVEFIFGFFLFEIPYSPDLIIAFMASCLGARIKLFLKERER